MAIKICKHCNKEFKTYNTKRIFCCAKCSNDSRKLNLTEAEKQERKLIRSKNYSEYYKQYKIKNSELIKKKDFLRGTDKCECGNIKYKVSKKCSKCRAVPLKQCPNCLNEFKPRTHVETYCSYECYKEHRIKSYSGENNPNWSGGKKLINQIGRHDVKHRIWIKSIMERDNYTCQKCGQIGGKLNAHHIIKWADDKDKRFDLDNGITLCVICHRKEHNWTGY